MTDAPLWIVVADFNGDARPDIALSAATIGIALAQEGGEYTTTALPPFAGTGRPPIAVGDLDGDGAPELVVVRDGASAGVYMNDGKGAFTARTAQPLSQLGSFSKPWLADVNGDGKSDLIMLTTLGPRLQVYMGFGGGAFSPAPISTQLPVQYGDVAIAELNGDGRPDAVLVNYSTGRLDAWRGEPGGLFTLINSTAVQAAVVGTLAAGDFNGDGKADVAVRNSGNTDTISVSLNDGSGRLGASSIVATGGVATLFLADMNGDRNLDIVSYDAAGAYWLAGHGDGTFDATRKHASPANIFFTALGDLNRDGAPDFIVAEGGAALGRIYLSRCPPSRRRSVRH